MMPTALNTSPCLTLLKLVFFRKNSRNLRFMRSLVPRSCGNTNDKNRTGPGTWLAEYSYAKILDHDL